MKKAKRREVKHTISKPTEFDKDYERRLRAEFEFRHLTRKLRRVQEWMPRLIMEHPNTKPEEVIKELRGQREKVWENLAELRKNRIGELYRIPMPQPPDGINIRPDPYELLKNIKKYHHFLEGMRKKAGILAEFLPGEPPPREEEPIEGIAWSDELRELLTLMIYPSGADYASIFTKEYSFDPYQYADRGILGYKTQIDNPHNDSVTLKTSAALKFTFPRAPFDALVWWWMDATLCMPYTLDADEAHFKVDWIFCERPDASVPGPWNYQFDKSVPGPSVSVSNGRVESYKLDHRARAGLFRVNEGDISEVYIGVDIELEVEDGIGGTFTGWGSLIFWAFPGEEIWGVKYVIDPLSHYE